MRVPRERGDGPAKVTITIPEWDGPKLPPAMFAVPLPADDGKIQKAKPWKEGQR